MMRIVPSVMALLPTGRSADQPRQTGPKKHSIPRFSVPGKGTERVKGFVLRLFRLEFQRCRIDAVAQSGRRRAVLEHVAEMAVTTRAKHLGPNHAVGDVALLVDMALGCRPVETRPAAAGIELGIGLKQRLPAAGTDIGTRPMVMLVFAGEWPFGRLLP